MTTDALDVKPTASSPSEGADASRDSSLERSTEGQPIQTLGDYLKEKFPVSAESAPATPDEQPPASPVVSDNKTPEGQPVAPEATPQADKAEDKGPVPYERFAEVNQTKTALEQKVAEMEPQAVAYRRAESFCQQNNISVEEYQNGLQLMALIKNDPQKALEQLKPLITQLQQFSGEVLPTDLQAAVDNGEMSLAFAKRLVAAEAKQRFGGERLAQTQAQIAERQQQEYLSSLANTTQAWATDKRQHDPDFQPKAKPTDANGKFEIFMLDFQSRISPQTVRNAADLVKLAEEAYASASATVSRFAPPGANGHRSLRSGRSTAASPKTPQTLAEAVAAAAAKHGIAMHQ